MSPAPAECRLNEEKGKRQSPPSEADGWWLLKFAVKASGASQFEARPAELEERDMLGTRSPGVCAGGGSGAGPEKAGDDVAGAGIEDTGLSEIAESLVCGAGIAAGAGGCTRTGASVAGCVGTDTGAL